MSLESGRTRYFPELIAGLLAIKAMRFMLDAEIVVPQDGTFSFDALLQRIHPAPTRVRRLTQEAPARLIIFHLRPPRWIGRGLAGRPAFARAPP